MTSSLGGPPTTCRVTRATVTPASSRVLPAYWLVDIVHSIVGLELKLLHLQLNKSMSRMVTHTHTSQFYGRFPRVSKYTSMVFQDNPGWPFSLQLKWINSQISDCGMDSTEVPPAGQRQITSTNTCFIRHCPNQSEHHATLPNIILNYPSVFKR
jgi:hypothetical protein